MTGVRSTAPVTRRVTAPVLALLGGLLLAGPPLAGCSTSVAGSAAPAAATPTRAPSGSPAPAGDYGAPRVTTPLDTTKFQPNPCGTLTPAQQHALGIDAAGTLQPSALGNICQWILRYNVVYSLGFNVTFEYGQALGLANAYENAGPGVLRRLPDVHGQPAVTDPSQNTEGACTVYLGATDQIDYAASVQIGPDQPHYQDPCSVAGQLADDATATMRSGGPAS